MFKTGDTVIYGIHGVCKITGTEENDFSGEKKQYYVLRPVDSENSTLFVPTDNEKLTSKMHKLLTKEEVDGLIDSMPQNKANWIANDNERKEIYRKIIADGNHSELIGMIKAIYLQKKEREEKGKHLHAADERFFNEAEQVLYSEFQYVLNLNKEDLMSYIFSRIEGNTL